MSFSSSSRERPEEDTTEAALSVLARRHLTRLAALRRRVLTRRTSCRRSLSAEERLLLLRCMVAFSWLIVTVYCLIDRY